MTTPSARFPFPTDSASPNVQASQVTEDNRAARRRFRLIFFITVIGSFLAAMWDGWYHTQVPFDGFFSPPHVFGYLVAASAGLLVNDTVFNHRLRRQFGPGFKVPLIPFPVPGSLFILGAGFVMLGFAGLVLDNYWHSTFGLDETNWSAPHAMIGWAFAVIVSGLISARLALGKLTWPWTLTFGWLAGLMLLGAGIAGPIAGNNTPETVAAAGQIPVIASQPDAMRAIQIQLTYNLDRTNPLFVILAPLGAALSLAFVRKLDGRWWMFLLIALLLSGGNRNTTDFLSRYVEDINANTANFEGLPIIWMAGIFLLLSRFTRSGIAWAVAGLVYALFVHWQYDGQAWAIILALLALIVAPLGAALGERLYGIVAAPTTWRKIAPFILAGVIFPVLTGLIDLYLRSNLPQ